MYILWGVQSEMRQHVPTEIKLALASRSPLASDIISKLKNQDLDPGKPKLLITTPFQLSRVGLCCLQLKNSNT